MKNKIKRVALYDPYLDTLGGGEKHILSILEVFAEQGYEVNIFWDKNLTKEYYVLNIPVRTIRSKSDTIFQKLDEAKKSLKTSY